MDLGCYFKMKEVCVFFDVFDIYSDWVVIINEGLEVL